MKNSPDSRAAGEGSPFPSGEGGRGSGRMRVCGAIRVIISPHRLSFDTRSASPMPVAFSELLDAFEFISSDPMFGNSARVNRETGAVHWHSDQDPELFGSRTNRGRRQIYRLAHAAHLDLDRPLVMRFAAERMDDPMTRSPTSFPARAPIAASRISWPKSARSRAGTNTRTTRKKKRCARGARRMDSRSRGRPCHFANAEIQNGAPTRPSAPDARGGRA